MSDRETTVPRVAYLINQYPKVSHTFIRREILALEEQGVVVARFALRGWDSDVVDQADIVERDRTLYTLKDGTGPVLRSALRQALRRPAAFAAAFRAAWTMSRRAVRPLPYHLIYLAQACRLLEWLETDPVSHLHAHFGTNSAEIACLLRILGGPSYSFTIHGQDEIEDAKRLHFPRKVAEADFAVAVSAHGRSQMLRELPYEDWKKIRVVHCGLDEAFLDGNPPPLPEAPALLCIGRLSPEKGHLILLDAFARVLATRPDATLVLAGDGPMRREVEARIAERGLSEAVRVTGWIDSAQIRSELSAAKILVQPSFIEGIPVVIMEAMALGRPVISTFVGGIPELVVPGETGWLVPAGDSTSLAEAIEAAISGGAEELCRMGQAAQARVRTRHSAPREAAKLSRLFAGDPGTGDDQ